MFSPQNRAPIFGGNAILIGRLQTRSGYCTERGTRARENDLPEKLAEVSRMGREFLKGKGNPMTRIPLSVADEESRSLKERLEMSTAEIGLTVRTTNCLEERGIFSVEDLLNCTPDDLLSISNFGDKTLTEVYSALSNIGFDRPGV